MERCVSYEVHVTGIGRYNQLGLCQFTTDWDLKSGIWNLKSASDIGISFIYVVGKVRWIIMMIMERSVFTLHFLLHCMTRFRYILILILILIFAIRDYE